MKEIIDTHYWEAIGSIHILPFFPSSGDRFVSLCYDKVDEKFGTFEDLRRIGGKYSLMYNFMVNHISAASDFYQDFKHRKEASPYKNMFIRYKEFWEDQESAPAQVDKIYKREPKAPYVDLTFADGSREKIWCTFSEEQMDLNVKKKKLPKSLFGILLFLCVKTAKKNLLKN